MTATLRVSIDVPLEPATAFERVLDELTFALKHERLEFQPGPSGRLAQGDFVVGDVVTWEPGRRALLRWHAASWKPDDVTEVELRVDPSDGGSTIVLEHRGWGRLVGDANELPGWFASAVVAPLVRETTPAGFGEWFTDRYARRPSGAQARATYADPLYHYPNFRVILSELELTPDDYLLEVGCGGGALLKAALGTGCRAAAIDHSPEMVQVARQTNAAALAEGRLEVFEGDAHALPFEDSVFTCAVMTGVLGFLADPGTAFTEIHRVLRPGGRFVGLGSDPELRGTPGAPEPLASRLRFYDADELERLAHAAGFDEVRVLRRDLEPFAREAGVPEEHLPLFAAKPGEGARFLVCRRGGAPAGQPTRRI